MMATWCSEVVEEGGVDDTDGRRRCSCFRALLWRLQVCKVTRQDQSTLERRVELLVVEEDAGRLVLKGGWMFL